MTKPKARPQQAKNATGESIEWREPSTLTPDPRNTRTHTDEQVAEVRASLDQFGWTNPMLITRAGRIVAGEARWRAAQLPPALESCKCLVIDGMTDAELRAYAIADNKLALNAGWDPELLRLELTELGQEGFTPDVLGFTDDDVSRILDDADQRRLAGLAKGGGKGPNGETNATGGEDHDTFTTPVTPLQMGVIRTGLKRAKEHFSVKTTGEALTEVVTAWLATLEGDQ